MSVKERILEDGSTEIVDVEARTVEVHPPSPGMQPGSPNDAGRAWLSTMLAAEINRCGYSPAKVKQVAGDLRRVAAPYYVPRIRLAVLLAAALAELDEPRCPPCVADHAGERVVLRDATGHDVRFTCKHCGRTVLERREPNAPKA